MALTIEQTPQLYTPSDNPVTWVFSSDQTAQNNFYFLIEVYIDSVKVEEHKIFPEFENKAHFDASMITERFSKITSIQGIGFETDGDNYNSVRIDVSEYFGEPVSVGDLVSTSDVNVFKARLTKRDFVNYDYNDYLLLDGVVTKPLTYFPNGEKNYISQGQKAFISVLNSGDFIGTSVRTYDSLGNILNTYNILSSRLDKVLTFDVSMGNLTSVMGVDFTNAVRYDFIVLATGGSTEMIFFDIDDRCNFTNTRLHFLNTLGGFDSFTFNLFDRENFKTESFGYERQYGDFNEAGVYSYGLEEGTNVDYIKRTSRELVLTSDWMNQNVQNWLVSQLYTSPVVYLERDGSLFRCKVVNSSFNYKKDKNDMTIQEVVTLMLENDLSVNV